MLTIEAGPLPKRAVSRVRVFPREGGRSFVPSPPGQELRLEKATATDMSRMLLVSCLVACCAALQPSQMLSTRTAQAGQRTAAPVMKRSDYFLRVSRSEAGRPRLCVFRWASAATN